MPRYFIRISFKGTHYAGWQIQKNAVTIQEILDRSLHTILGTPVVTTGCGRTDAGVHASRFYAHFDVPSGIEDLSGTVYRLNAVLPVDIAAHELIRVDERAHARYDAVSRTYHYLVTATRNPFLREYACFFSRPLDLDSMNAAADLLTGKGDYASFSKTKSETKTTLCHIMRAGWNQRNLLVFSVTADRFLRGMVRAMVGTMFEVGTGRKSAETVRDILYARDRSRAGAAAPACGLFLTDVAYPYLPSPESPEIPFYS